MDPNVASPVAVPKLPLSVALKQATADLHTRAEKHPAQARMVGGRATREEYSAFLVQMAALHAYLEPALRELVSGVPALHGVVRPHHFRQAAASADLRALGQQPEQDAPLPATSRFCKRLVALSRHDPVALLGVLYVLEGATNGGRFIAAAVRPALSLPDGIGTAYLDPHGPFQRERWAQFRTSVDEQGLSSAEQAAVIAAAYETFEAVYEILEDLNSLNRLEQA